MELYKQHIFLQGHTQCLAAYANDGNHGEPAADANVVINAKLCETVTESLSSPTAYWLEATVDIDGSATEPVPIWTDYGETFWYGSEYGPRYGCWFTTCGLPLDDEMVACTNPECTSEFK